MPVDAGGVGSALSPSARTAAMPAITTGAAMEAIKSGALELNDLANYVDNVSLIKRAAPGTTNSSVTYSNRWALQGSSQPADSRYLTGGDILGLITWAAGGQKPGDPVEYREARVQVTAFSGSASEKELDPSKREVAFSYLLRVVIDARRAPENDPDDNSLPFDSVAGNTMSAEEHFGYPGGTSLAEVQLTFYYPYIGENKTPPRSQTFRASVARQVVNDPFNVNPDIFYLRP